MYYLYHIRKTGGRSIIHSFLALVANDPEIFYERLAKQPGHRLKKDNKIFIGWDTSTLKRGDFFFAFSHAPIHSFSLPRQAYSITCLRNPLARLMSYYNYLIDIKQAIKENPKHVHANMPDLAWAHDNQVQFLKDAPKQHLINQLFMFSKRMRPKEAANNISRIGLVLQTEDMLVGIKKLAQLTRLKLQPLHFGATKTKREFSDEFLDEAERILRPEFNLMQRLTDRGLL